MPRGTTKRQGSTIAEPEAKKTVICFFSTKWMILFCLIFQISSVLSINNWDPMSMKAAYNQDHHPAYHELETAPVARVQKPAPYFKAPAVVNGEFKDVSLDDYKGKYLVLFFYPLDFTFVCPTEIIAFSDRFEEFKKIGCEVAAVSVDSKFTHLAWINTPRKEGGLGKMNIPLISDLSKTISRDYGVLLEDGEDQGISLRGLFIISDKGIIRQITINDLPVGRSVDETLRLVQAFQQADKNPGQVCPVDWKPGSETMTADSQKAKDYFRKFSKE